MIESTLVLEIEWRFGPKSLEPSAPFSFFELPCRGHPSNFTQLSSTLLIYQMLLYDKVMDSQLVCIPANLQ